MDESERRMPDESSGREKSHAWCWSAARRTEAARMPGCRESAAERNAFADVGQEWTARSNSGGRGGISAGTHALAVRSCYADGGSRTGAGPQCPSYSLKFAISSRTGNKSPTHRLG